MKAFLLAAGKGTRLRPYTDTCPKCMMDINGKPLLQIWIEKFEETGIDHVLINTHYLHKMVEDFIDKFKKKTPVKITLSHEKQLLGSGGTLKANKNFVDMEERFMVIYADNLTNTNLNEIIDFHKKSLNKFNQIMTMGLFETSRPTQCGIAEISQEGKIESFIEKPKNPESNLANSGIYVCEKKFLNFFDKKDKPLLDIGFDILPLLNKKMMGFRLSGFIKDIGSVKNYKESLIKWKELNNQ